MPNGIPEQLDAEGRALYGLIGGYFGQGVGADRAYALLRDEGFSIPRQAVRNVYAENRATLQNSAELTRVHPDNPIPERLFQPDSHLQQEGYYVRARVSVVDLATGYTGVSWYTYRSDTPPTPSDVYNDAASVFETEQVPDNPIGDTWQGVALLSVGLVSANVAA